MLSPRQLTTIAVAALVALWLTMMLTGTGVVDRALLHALYSADRPALRSYALFVTNFGEWQVLITLTLLGAAWLLYLSKRRSAALLLSITLLGRLLVDLQKIGIGRLRPEDQAHLVPVNSLSFPSAHSANTMIVYLSLALLVPDRRYRPLAVAIALAGTVIVGTSRPMLGVHWPSDVVGGWSFGAAWVLALIAAAKRWPAREEAGATH